MMQSQELYQINCLVFFLHQVKIYLKGNRDFCSIAADRKLALIGIVKIPPNDARSVAVPIVPKIIGKIKIEVWSFVQTGLPAFGGGDAVKRILFVVVRVL